MPITATALVDPVQRKDGSFRVSLGYQFTGGRSIVIGPISVPTLVTANLLLNARESQVLQQMQWRDAEEVMSLNLDVAHGEASTKLVYRAWILEGLEETESRRAYAIIKKVIQKVQDLGLTVAQAAVQLELDEDQVERLLDRWTYLNANSAAIIAYQAVKAGDI